MDSQASRAVPERSINACLGLPIVLATDVGLLRSENQDRVAAFSARTRAGRHLVAVAVADGMGGMRDGGKCATLALSSFFYSLIIDRSADLHRRVLSAISYANEEVFKFADGKGGATLGRQQINW